MTGNDFKQELEKVLAQLSEMSEENLAKPICSVIGMGGYSDQPDEYSFNFEIITEADEIPITMMMVEIQREKPKG